MANGPELAELYKIRFSNEELPRKLAIWRVLCRQWFQKFIPANGTVIDVACGYGEFINNIEAARRIAIDLNRDARDRVGLGVEFRQLPATQLRSLGEGIGDVIFVSNFLEHLPDKAALDLFLDEVMATLKPGGRFVILGPNLRYLAGEYWDFYDHHLGLTHLSLSEALQLKRFRIDLCIDKFLPYTTQGALPTHPALVSLYLKVPLAWRLLGKQFFIVASKPA
jgi:SAM-dependent methyltransferase